LRRFGILFDAELHWYEAHGIGKVKMKIRANPCHPRSKAFALTLSEGFQFAGKFVVVRWL